MKYDKPGAVPSQWDRSPVFYRPPAPRVPMAQAEKSERALAFPVVFVDLDGTLLATDVTTESFLRAIRARPLVIFLVPFWLLRGRPYFKDRLLQVVPQPEDGWPYHREVVELLREFKSRGIHLVLATASHRSIADRVAADLNLFDAVLGTDSAGVNLKGRNKLAAIEDYCHRCGYETFAYMGDAMADLPIWEHSAEIYAVGPGARLKRKIAALRRPTQIIETHEVPRWRELIPFFPRQRSTSI